MKSITGIVVLLLTVMIGRADDARLVRARGVYRQGMAEVYQAALTQLLDGPKEFAASLGALEKAYQRAGDLENLLLVRRERERFVEEQAPGLMIVSDACPELASRQQSYIEKQERIKQERSKGFEDVRARFRSSMLSLQKALTKEGRIEEALAISDELERVEATVALEEASHAFKELRQSGRLGTRSSAASGDALGIDGIRALLRGEVRRWNPRTREIALFYDFAQEDAMDDWHGGRISARGALSANKEVAWMIVQFESISRIEYTAGFMGGDRTRLQVGSRFFADMIGGTESEGRLYQGSVHNPIISFFERFHDGVSNKSTLDFSSNGVAWGTTSHAARETPLQTRIAYPTRMGLGCESSMSAYDEVLVEGVLTQRSVEWLLNRP